MSPNKKMTEEDIQALLGRVKVQVDPAFSQSLQAQLQARARELQNPSTIPAQLQYPLRGNNHSKTASAHPDTERGQRSLLPGIGSLLGRLGAINIVSSAVVAIAMLVFVFMVLVPRTVTEGSDSLIPSWLHLRSITPAVVKTSSIEEVVTPTKEPSAAISTPVSIPSLLEEREALVALYETTGGQQWAKQDAWLSNQSICEWEGVTCANNHVVTLDLYGNNLQGELPPEISQLTNLEELILINDHIFKVPLEMSRLTSLQHIDMLGNPILRLPPEVCQIPGLSVWPVALCDFLTPLPGNSPEMTVALSDGTLPCGLAQMEWGQQAFAIEDYPACLPVFPEVAVYCLGDQGQWTNDLINVIETSVDAKAIVVEAQREGICGIFPQNQ